MDISTLFGILAGFALILMAIFMGGSETHFVNIPGMMIVFGGTAASTFVTFPLEEVLGAFRGGARTLFGRGVTPVQAVNTMVRIADISRRDGLLALENIHTDNAVLKKSCQLISDNASPHIIHDMLSIEIASMKRRHNISIEVFNRLGAYAPAFGMIGTLIGLVQMLSNLEDPESIGPGMAVAILTTFYGTMLAYIIFLPVAGKLRARSLQEELNLQIIFEGARCILENNNPRLVYDKLSSFVPPKERNKYREK